MKIGKGGVLSRVDMAVDVSRERCDRKWDAHDPTY